MKSAATILLLGLSVLEAGAETWTLREALAFARTNAPDTRIAQHRIRAAQAGLQQANAAFWPKVQLQSSYTRTDNPVSVFGSILNQRSYSPSLNFNDVPDVDHLNVRGVLTVPLYAGGRNKAGRESAKQNAQATRAEAESVRNSLEFEVVRAFYTAAKARRFIEATESGARSLESNRALAEKRVNAGNLLKTELLDIEVQLGQAREDLARARNGASLAMLALKNLLGLENGALEIEEDSFEQSLPGTKAGFTHPEMRALYGRQNASEAEVRRARGGYLPQVDAFGQVDHDSGWKYNTSGRSYAVGVVAKWDLWDGNLTRGRVREARARAGELAEEERKLRLALGYASEEAQLRLEEANERLAVTDQTVKQAEESVRMTRARFEQGLALSTQLIDGERALTSARIRRAEAESDRRIAIAALRQAHGLTQLEGE